tara:strand:- start:6644 stop:7012 length:369 start_codon:yes stop_codon:yes gene_type:complete
VNGAATVKTDVVAYLKDHTLGNMSGEESFLPRPTVVTPPRAQLACYICTGALVMTHLILMVVLVASIAAVAPEIKTTLDDVRLMVPQMHLTLRELGKMLPKITQGMRILDQLCADADNCRVA